MKCTQTIVFTGSECEPMQSFSYLNVVVKLCEENGGTMNSGGGGWMGQFN